MKYRPRIYYTESQKALMWERWRKGESLQQIAQLFDRNHSAIQRILAETGGIQPRSRCRSRLALSLAEREEISRGLVAGHSIRSIALLLRRAPSTISREIDRNGGVSGYRASQAEQAAWDRALRPKSCKLAENQSLAHLVADKLRLQWSVPPSPCRLEVALQGMGYQSSFIEDTQEIFSNLAASARRRFLVMTPFLDQDGGERLLNLFGSVVDGVEKQLIVRCSNGKAPEGLQRYAEEFRTLGVTVSNYWIPKEKANTYETFHAKVMLADASRCYVGSANMTSASINYSMELGMLLEGKGAKTVSWMCDVILGIALASSHALPAFFPSNS